MCGIAGFINITRPVSEQLLEQMGKSIRHRGPDAHGVFLDPQAGLGMSHQRLSIIELSDLGRQPMTSSSGRITVCYNGEIYNHLEIRKELQQEGCVFKGGSDTETLVEAIDVWGLEESISKLNGMFAFASWNKETGELSLVRDRLGIKPLYYGWLDDSFVFASELKPFKVYSSKAAEGALKVCNDACSLLLSHNYIPAPHSIYQKVFKLEPGALFKISSKSASKPPRDFSPFCKQGSGYPKPYWSLAEFAKQGAESPRYSSYQDAKDSTESLLRSSVEKRLMSDVPLGVFLSGGIDSSLVAAFAQEVSSSPVKSFSIGFNDDSYNEAVYAKQVAEAIGSDHTEFYVDAEQALDVVPKLPLIYDEPFADSSQIPTYLVSKLARDHVTVALSGDGGDEGFYGYSRYVWAAKLWKYMSLSPHFARSGFGKLIELTPEVLINSLYAAAKPVLPDSLSFSAFGSKLKRFAELVQVSDQRELYHRLLTHWLNPNSVLAAKSEVKSALLMESYTPEFESFNNEMMYRDYLAYIPGDLLTKVDRASMAVSLEVRVPFLDHRLVESALATPFEYKYDGKTGKRILRDILFDRVPRELVDRPKVGFGVPMGSWLKGSLRDWTEDLLSKEKIDKFGVLQYSQVREKWDEHLAGKRNWQYLLWDVLSLQAWLDQN